MTIPTVLTTHPMNTSFSYNVIHTRAIREKPGGFKYSYAMYLVYQFASTTNTKSTYTECRFKKSMIFYLSIYPNIYTVKHRRLIISIINLKNIALIYFY